MKQSKIRVFLVDDHPVVRAGLRSYFAISDDIRIVGEASSVAEALPLIEASHPDVVLMDLLMPGIDGIAGTRQVCQRFPHVQVLVLTVVVDGARERQLLNAGAAGYLTKHVTGSDIVSAIRAVSVARDAAAL
jgi:NarL family two-component system response regulator LiaR